MKSASLPLVIVLAALAAASCRGEDPSPPPAPDAHSSARQHLERVESDSQMPDGLKRIKTESLRRQPGIGP